jgi:hypothetical protein
MSLSTVRGGRVARDAPATGNRCPIRPGALQRLRYTRMAFFLARLGRYRKSHGVTYSPDDGSHPADALLVDLMQKRFKEIHSVYDGVVKQTGRDVRNFLPYNLVTEWILDEMPLHLRERVPWAATYSTVTTSHYGPNRDRMRRVWDDCVEAAGPVMNKTGARL